MIRCDEVGMPKIVYLIENCGKDDDGFYIYNVTYFDGTKITLQSPYLVNKNELEIDAVYFWWTEKREDSLLH